MLFHHPNIHVMAGNPFYHAGRELKSYESVLSNSRKQIQSNFGPYTASH